MGRTLLITVVLFAAPSILSADQWPQWRGPHGSGVTRETNLPSAWSATTNLAWRAALPGAGVSSPTVWGDLVFVTSQAGAGVRRTGSHPTLVQNAPAGTATGEGMLTAGSAASDRVTFVVSAHRWSDGSLAWKHELPSEGALPAVHDKHNLATPSPVTDGEIVVAWFGTGQIVALDLEGKPLWTKAMGTGAPFDLQWGHSSSPVIHDDQLLLLCYHGSASYLVSVDKRTGAELWRANRPAGLFSYSTPVVVERGARDLVVVNSSTGVHALRADNGELVWEVKEDNRFPIPVPSIVDGVIYTTRGYRSGPMLAIRPDGSGDVTTSHVLWRVPTGAPYVPSLLHYDGLIYTAGELGVVTCFDAKTGERLWQERVGGVFTGSPVAGDDKIYFTSETGETIVLRAGRAFSLIGRNQLNGHFVASPAISRGRIFLRSDDALFAVGKGTQ
jgi:outer membrane protein assembly factor BamB